MPRSGRARRTRAARSETASCSHYRAGAAARRPRARPVPPDGAARRQRPRRLPALGGAARRRARRCSTTAASASSTSSRRATSSRVRSPRGPAHGSTCARSSATAIPTLMATLERAGYDPAREPIPVSPAAHYADRRHRHRPRRTHDGARALRGRRVRVHRRARREPARLELAARVPRLRPPCRSRRTRRARASTPTRTPVAPAADARRARSGATRGSSAARPGSTRCSTRRTRSSAEIAACGLAREESRGVHFRDDFPVESDALAGHLVVHPGREPVLERWS